MIPPSALTESYKGPVGVGELARWLGEELEAACGSGGGWGLGRVVEVLVGEGGQTQPEPSQSLPKGDTASRIDGANGLLAWASGVLRGSLLHRPQSAGPGGFPV